MDKRESFYWDVVKGFAIFLMLWGHCIQYCAKGVLNVFEDIVFKTIYTFHMPVFMLVSGYLFYYSFQKRNMEELLEHRLRSMLHPLVMATFLNNVLMLVPQYIFSKRADVLFGSLFHGIGEDLWFLWAVLYCSLVVGFCCKCTDRTVLQILLVILGTIVILLFPQWNMTLFMYPYFVAGFFCGKYRNCAKRLFKIIKYAMLVLFPVMVTFYEMKHYIYITPIFSEELGLAESLKIACFRCAIGFAGSISMLAVVEWVVCLGAHISALERCLQAVSLLGRNSLQIYCLSASLLSGYLPKFYRKFVELAGGNLFAKNWIIYDFCFTPLQTVAWSVLLYYLVLLMKKCRLHRIIFGR